MRARFERERRAPAVVDALRRAEPGDVLPGLVADALAIVAEAEQIAYAGGMRQTIGADLVEAHSALLRARNRSRSDKRAVVSIVTDGQSECVTAKQARTLVALGLCIPHPGVRDDGIEAGDLRLADGASWPDVYGAVEAMRDEPADAWSAASHGEPATTAMEPRCENCSTEPAAFAVEARSVCAKCIEANAGRPGWPGSLAEAQPLASHGDAASTAISERGVAELLDEFAKHDPHVALWASVPDASEADELVMDVIACEAMSDRFATFAREHGYDPMLVTLDGADDALVWTHTIVRLSGGCYVDWTARQYHNADVPLDRLPCPLVLVDPFAHPVGFTTATLYEPSSQRA